MILTHDVTVKNNITPHAHVTIKIDVFRKTILLFLNVNNCLNGCLLNDVSVYCIVTY